MLVPRSLAPSRFELVTVLDGVGKSLVLVGHFVDNGGCQRPCSSMEEVVESSIMMALMMLFRNGFEEEQGVRLVKERTELVYRGPRSSLAG